MSVRARWSVLALLLLLPLLVAFQGAASDVTGIFGPVIDRAWPVVAAFLGSLLLKVAAKASELTRKLPEPAKWVLLYFFSLGWNLFARYAGIAEVDPLTETWLDGALIPAFQAGGAALIYKFGGRKVPALEPRVGG